LSLLTALSRTIRLVVEYDGTAFSGWQEQEPGRLTVQVALQEAVKQMTGEAVHVRAASRTDSGVHARGQVAAFDTENQRIPIYGFERGLGQYLPDAVSIRRAEEVETGWNPRFTSRGKRYCYTYWNDRQPSALERWRAWQVRNPLDLEAMQTAADHLLGTHDFEAFRSAGCSAKHAVRTLYQVTVRRGDYARIHVDVVGNAFVRNMVRIIAGNLKEVGDGTIGPQDMLRILESKDRKEGGVTAPGWGLCLEEVIYDDRLPARPKDDQDLGDRKEA
jgi:tRNA pseudouridine38-40 synthase